jgi:cytochrome c oxidase subunit 3
VTVLGGSEARDQREVDGLVGMAIFLGATTMLFAGFLLAYVVLRAQAPAWPPPGTSPFPTAAAGANSLLLLAATLFLRRGRAHAALVLGIGFVVAQVVLWRHLVIAHLGPGAGTLGDTFFTLSVLHALHVVGGLAALAVRHRTPGRALTLYWDFVLVVWLVVLIVVCVL